MSFNFRPPSITDVRQLTTGASNLLSRARQYTEEKLGSAQKTEFDVDYETVNVVFEKTKKCAETLKSQTEITLQPNPSARIEDFVYHKLDRPPPVRPSNYQNLGSAMIEAGQDFGSATTYGEALIKCGEIEMKVGNSDNLFFQKVLGEFLQPLNGFLEGDCKTIQHEKKVLERKRLDLDACKSRVRKSKSQDSKHEAETSLRATQSEFDRQQEVTRLLLEAVSKNQATHTRNLIKFVQAQTEYIAACHEHMKELNAYLQSVEPFIGTRPSSSRPSVEPRGSVRSSPKSLISTRPSSARRTVEPQGSPRSSSKEVRARVLYDYDAANAAELSLLADEVISLEEKPQQGQTWVLGQRGKNRGKVPVNYITLMD